MRLRSIELEGFRSFREPERVDLTGLNLTAIIGANHQGKSSLIHALEFALYGRSVGATVSDVISRGQDRAVVSVEFDLGDTTYRVTRGRTRKGRHEVYVYVSDPAAEDGWKPLEEKYSKTGADPFIVSLLGMDSPTARATWLITQGDFGSFCEMDPAPRRAVLASAFGLDAYEVLARGADEKLTSCSLALEKARYDHDRLTARHEALGEGGPFPEIKDEDLKSRIEEAEKEADRLTAALAALEDPELEARAKEARDALSAFDAAHQREVSRYTQDKARIERSLAEARDLLTQAAASREQAESAVWEVDEAEQALETARANVTKAEGNIGSLREKVSEFEAQRAALTSEKDATTAQANEINERIETLKTSAEKGEGKCFTCGQSLTPEHAHSLIEEQEQRKEDLRKEFTTKRDSAATAEQQAAEVRAQVSALERDLSAARRAERDAEQALTRVRELAGSVDLWTEREQGQNSKIEALEEELLDLGKPPEADTKRRLALSTAAEKAQAALDAATGDQQEKVRLTSERDGFRARMKSLWQEQVRREQTTKELADLVEPIKEAAQSVTDISKDVTTYSALRDAFRPAGIPAMILAGVVEELNEEANDILAEMGSDLGVLVTTQKETQKGTSQEKVMVYAITPDGPVDYKTLSGQEKVYIALSLRLALSACIARRTGTPIETIILDEGWGALDDDSKNALKGALERIASRFSVYTITHIESVKAGFPTVIRVDASSGTSRVEVSGQ